MTVLKAQSATPTTIPEPVGGSAGAAITKITTRAGSTTKERPVRDAIQTLDQDGWCRVEITLDNGVVGTSSIGFGRQASSPMILAKLIDDQITPAIIGADATLIRGIRHTLRWLLDYHGATGLASFAMAAIDIALWDALGKSVGRPVWQLLGAQRSAVPVYAMVGWLELDIAGLQRVSGQAMEQGFGGVKVKVGGGSLSDDLARIGAVRQVIGDDVPLMVDANQAFGLDEALRRGRAYEGLGCRWFEEPIEAADTAGHIRLAERLDIPIATGENRNGQRQFRDLIAGGGVRVVQPDLRRAGGITDCLEIGLMAAGFGVEYASHGSGPHVHVLAALPNTIFMESGLLPPGVELRDGCLPLPTEPGL